jgi:hypothetical protein
MLTDTAETGARRWRLEHLDAYQDTRAWLSREAKVVDATGIAPTQVAHLIAANVGQRPKIHQSIMDNR